MRLLSMLVLTASLLLAPSALAQETADPATLPLLPQQRHIGSTFYGGGAPPPQALMPRIDDATAAGMNAFTFYLDWPALEPAPGVYDLADLRASLEWANANGLSTFANITVIDIEDLVMLPEYLGEPAGEFATLADGVRLNDPGLIARFTLLLDAVVPLMVEQGVFYLGVGNEVDGWLNANPDALDDYLAFIAAARAHVRTIAPELAVGITVTGGVPIDAPDLLDRFYSVADVVSANLYGIDVSDFTVSTEAETAALFDAFIAPFAGRPLVIPEFGCVSATSMNGSEAQQAECYAQIMDILGQQDNLRFATAFTFADFDAETCALVQSIFGFDEEGNFANIYEERVADYLCTMGIVNADGSPKAAFTSFLEGLAALTGGA